MSIKVVLLCAGYGTRLERDILNCSDDNPSRSLLGKAKGMLPIGGKPLIAYWINLLLQRDEFDQFFIVTNERFYPQFSRLVEEYDSKVLVLNDGTTCNKDRMGAVASISYAIRKFHLENDDVLVIAGDTLFYEDFSIEDFVQKFYKTKNSSPQCCLVTMYTCKDWETTKYGILEVDESSGKVKGLTEKPQPQETKSRLVCPCFYLFSSSSTKLIERFLVEKKFAPLKEKDAAGNLIKYMTANCDIYALSISGRFDVGGLESYKECDQYFSRDKAE